MNYKEHILGGIISYAGLLYLLKFLNYPLTTMHTIQWFLFCILGALFPDIDTKSKIQLWLYRLFFLIYLLIFIIHPTSQILIFVSILAIIPLIVHHRGIFHNIWFIASLSVASVIIIHFSSPHLPINEIAIAALFFMLGATSHLLLDRKIV